jgi:hypothetical protein
MGGDVMRWLLVVLAGVSIGVSGFAMGSASAQPVPSPPPRPAQPGSTSDELADMVLDVIENGAIAAPSTTPVPATR